MFLLSRQIYWVLICLIAAISLFLFLSWFHYCGWDLGNCCRFMVQITFMLYVTPRISKLLYLYVVGLRFLITIVLICHDFWDHWLNLVDLHVCDAFLFIILRILRVIILYIVGWDHLTTSILLRPKNPTRFTMLQIFLSWGGISVPRFEQLDRWLPLSVLLIREIFTA